ncbi:MAG: hypothetical protein M0R48_07660 [Candidatus Omnitrophica bacterium]|nr:hypothetical protein [Candidatus Omnitrophota bacterium]
MSWFKLSWLCRIFGHHFVLIRDLRISLKRERLIYRCVRCNHPVIIRQSEHRRFERRNKVDRRNAFRGQYDRRQYERRGVYVSGHDMPHLLGR